MTLLLATLGLAAMVGAGAALAAWSVSGDGAAGGRAQTVPAGNTPTARAAGTDVVVTWPATMLPNGGSATGYVVRRYDATGSVASVGADCAGTVSATSCTEHNVPAGTWTYTDTPLVVGWTGSASPQSNAVQVAATG